MNITGLRITKVLKLITSFPFLLLKINAKTRNHSQHPYPTKVDAVMTEDSDALLFGARKVLKDVFSGRKTATLYQAASIERKIGRVSLCLCI